MESKTSKFRCWHFTVNNYIEDDIAKLRSLAPSTTYLVFGKETGESGTPHLQGFVVFSSPRRATALHKLLPSHGHWTTMRSSEFASSKYCRKDGDFEEYGKRPTETRARQGKRSDLYEFRDAVEAGERCLKKLRYDFPRVAAKYPSYMSQVLLDQVPPPEFKEIELRAWQSELLEILLGSVNPRTILFVVDESGGAGKTEFTRYFEHYHGAKCVTLLPGKVNDMVYAFCQQLTDDTSVVFLDCPKSKQGDYIQYDILEHFKNGRVFNTKYQSFVKDFNKPHVVVFMNEYPDIAKLSQDRYHVLYCEKDSTFSHMSYEDVFQATQNLTN